VASQDKKKIRADKWNRTWIRVQNCQCISKFVRKISRKLSLVILTHTHRLLWQSLLTLKVWKKPLRFVVWTFSLELQIINLINKEKKNILRICSRKIHLHLNCNTRYNYDAAPPGLSAPTSYASRIVNVSAVNADARIEALGKAVW